MTQTTLLRNILRLQITFSEFKSSIAFSTELKIDFSLALNVITDRPRNKIFSAQRQFPIVQVYVNKSMSCSP